MIFISSTSSLSGSSTFAVVFIRHAYKLISIYKMNYHTDIVNFRGHLLGRDVCKRGVLTLKIFLFGGALI